MMSWVGRNFFYFVVGLWVVCFVRTKIVMDELEGVGITVSLAAI